MTISSGGAECRISYTINNYTKSLTYSWPTKDECYTEEDFSDGALTVQVLMADGTKQEITKYEITGYNEKLFDKQQTFTITYKDKVIDKTFTATGTCTFHMRSMRIRCYYYRDESLTDLAGSYSYAGNYDYYSDERVSLNAFRKDDLQDKDTMYNSKKYVLKSVEMEEADPSGNYAKKTTPYLVKERFFYGIRMTKIYVLSN